MGKMIGRVIPIHDSEMHLKTCGGVFDENSEPVANEYLEKRSWFIFSDNSILSRDDDLLEPTP